MMVSRAGSRPDAGRTRGVITTSNAVSELRTVAGVLDGASGGGLRLQDDRGSVRGSRSVGGRSAIPSALDPGQAEQTTARGASRRPTDKVRLSWRPGRWPAQPPVRVDGRRDGKIFELCRYG
jgi:hypothetical protein